MVQSYGIMDATISITQTAEMCEACYIGYQLPMNDTDWGNSMNEFVMDASTKLTPDEIVWCVMGTRTDQLVMDILENRGGKYDALYTSHQKRNPSMSA